MTTVVDGGLSIENPWMEVPESVADFCEQTFHCAQCTNKDDIQNAEYVRTSVSLLVIEYQGQKEIRYDPFLCI